MELNQARRRWKLFPGAVSPGKMERQAGSMPMYIFQHQEAPLILHPSRFLSEAGCPLPHPPVMYSQSWSKESRRLKWRNLGETPGLEVHTTWVFGSLAPHVPVPRLGQGTLLPAASEPPHVPPSPAAPLCRSARTQSPSCRLIWVSNRGYDISFPWVQNRVNLLEKLLDFGVKHEFPAKGRSPHEPTMSVRLSSFHKS